MLMPFSAELRASCGAPIEKIAPDEYRVTETKVVNDVEYRVSAAMKSEEALHRFCREFDEETRLFDGMMSSDSESALTRVNHADGDWVQVPCQLASTVKKALDVAYATEGRFDPTIGALRELWLKEGTKFEAPDRNLLNKAKRSVDYRNVDVDQRAPRCRLRLDADQQLYLANVPGGELLNTLLAKAGDAKRVQIEFEGHMGVMGEPLDARHWLLPIVSTGFEAENLGYIRLASGDTVASNNGAFGDFGNAFPVNPIDPETGDRIESVWSSVTVIDKDGARGSAVASALWLMDREKTEAFMAAHPDMRILIMTKDGKEALMSSSLTPNIFFRRDGIKLSEI